MDLQFPILCVLRIIWALARLFRQPRPDEPDDDPYSRVRFPNHPKLPHRYAAVALEAPEG
jgi:hypothetical protein